MENKTFSYDIPEVSIRNAEQDDLQIMAYARVVATQQKEHGQQQPTPFHVFDKAYHLDEADKMKRAWNTEGTQFIIANVPLHQVNFVIPDHNTSIKGSAVAGYCATRHDPKEDAAIFHLDDLFAVESQYPVGRILMDNCIEMAKQSGAERIRLNAPFKNSQKWYAKLGFEKYAPPGLVGMHFGGFGEEEVQNDTLSSQTQIVNLLELHRDNFDKAQDILRYQSTKHAAPKAG